jgi:protein TonB
MTRPFLSSAFLVLGFVATAAAQDGQGANARPDATPPTRPASLPPPSRTLIFPGGIPNINPTAGQQVQRLLLVYPTIQSPAPPAPTAAPAPTAPADPAVAAQEEFGKGAHKAGEPGLIQPVLKRQTFPKYTSAALRAKIQGEVKIEAVVLADGTVGDVRIVQSLDKALGLDEAAIAAVKQWIFDPGTLDAKPVPVLVTVMTEFRLH